MAMRLDKLRLILLALLVIGSVLFMLSLARFRKMLSQMG